MKSKKLSYNKILVLFCIVVALVLMTGCDGGVGFGSIEVNSTPSGARVYLDGADTGQVTPIVLNASAGDHTVKLSKYHYKDWADLITVITEQTTYLNPPLIWAPEESVTLQPDAVEGKDVYVMDIFPSDNFGDVTFLSIGVYTVPFARSYLQFNLSPVPPEAVILDANLGLHYDSSYGLTSLPIGLYEVTESWEEGTIT